MGSLKTDPKGKETDKENDWTDPAYAFHTSIFKSIPMCTIFQCCSSGEFQDGILVFTNSMYLWLEISLEKNQLFCFVFKICVFMYMCLPAFLYNVPCVYLVPEGVGFPRTRFVDGSVLPLGNWEPKSMSFARAEIH